jgi:hypothetical protein
VKRLVPFVLVLVACSKEAPRTTDTPAEAEAPAASTAASVPAPPSSAPAAASASASAAIPSATTPTTPEATTKLLDPGQAPRRKLRYAWHVDQKEQLVMDLRTGASTEVAGAKQPEIPLPQVHIAVDVDPARVSPDGTLSYAWRVTAATMTPNGQTPTAIADGMRIEVAAIEHLAGRGVVTSRGLSQDITVDPATMVDAGATGQMVEQVRQTLRDVAVPWPEEDVGRGARWQKISQLDAKGSHLTQTDTFTLVDVQGDAGAVDDMLAQTAPPQVLRSPGVPSGADAKMESMLASGSWKTRFDLTRLVPQTKFDGTTTMVVSGQSGSDSSRRITMVMRMGIEIQGTKR